MSKIRKVFSFNSRLDVVTGVQKVLLDVHQAVKGQYDAKIVGQISFERINKNLGIKGEEYVQIKNPFMFRNSIVIVHERKFLPLFWLMNILLFQKIKIVYVHHNLLYGFRRMSIMPKYVVCISESGRINLTDYFKVPLQNIHKIHNCVDDVCKREHTDAHNDIIKILYPARVNNVKRQIEIVQKLRGRLNKNIQILFAGNGPLYEDFCQEVKDDEQFVSLGFVENVPGLMRECDYVMLFSTHEGLPITLIEATMTGTPIICNDVGGNTEIAYDKRNAFVVNEWDDLLACLNNLGGVTKEQYKSMSEMGRSIYEKFFTFDIFKRKYLQLLESIN